MSAPSDGRRGGRLAVVDALRGIASFAVCWYHLVFANRAFGGSGRLAAFMRDSAQNTWTGVEVFFVISGFVVPLALYRSGYSPRHYGTFLLKRIVRLDPPYLASVVLCLVLGALSAYVRGLGPFHATLDGVLLHLGYLNAFAGKGWLNPVYWTLAIEFQYYLGVGLLFMALAHREWWVRLAFFAVLGGLAFLVPAPAFVFRYLWVFMLGMATFQYFAGLLAVRGYLSLLAVLAIGCALTLGPMVAVLALLAALVIAFVRGTTRILTFLGSISYSLYLVHVPVGGRVMNLLLPHAPSSALRCLVLALALAVTIAAAYCLYLAVERPAQIWSGRIRYGSRAGRLSPGRSEGAVATGIAEP